MKRTGICPKCEGRQFWRIETVQEHSGQADTVRPLNVAAHRIWGGLSRKDAGTYETISCAGCGYTEWYAQGLDQLTVDPKHGIYFVDNMPKAGSEGPER